MSGLHPQIKNVLLRGLDDWVHITEVVDLATQAARSNAASTNEQTIRDFICTLLGNQYSQVGTLVERTTSELVFEPYTGSTNELIERVMRYLETVAFRPQLDGDWWLCNTAKGDAAAKAD